MIVQAVPAAMSQLQSTVSKNFPCAEACSKIAGRPPSIRVTATTSPKTAPPISTTVWATSVQITASMPPATVYTMHSTPITRMQVVRSKLATVASASAGRYSTIAVRPH